jgi:hypothetical protein
MCNQSLKFKLILSGWSKVTIYVRQITAGLFLFCFIGCWGFEPRALHL